MSPPPGRRRAIAPPRLSFGVSSTLARQIEQGAPSNLFASADEQWMDYLDQRHLLAPGTRQDLLANRLVLIVPADRKAQVAIGPGFDLAALLGPNGRLATGDPAHVPVGIYAEQALTRLGLWEAIETASRPRPTCAARCCWSSAARRPPASSMRRTRGIRASMVAGVFPADSHDADHLSVRDRSAATTRRKPATCWHFLERAGGARDLRPARLRPDGVARIDPHALLSPAEWEAVRLTLDVAARSVAVRACRSRMLTAFLLARFRFPGHAALDAAAHLPLVLPPVVVGWLLLLLFGLRGPVGAWLLRLVRHPARVHDRRARRWPARSWCSR